MKIRVLTLQNFIRMCDYHTNACVSDYILVFENSGKEICFCYESLIELKNCLVKTLD